MLVGAMNHPARDVIQEITWIAEQGFDFVDLTLEPPAADPRTVDGVAIARTLEKVELPVVVHTAYYLSFATPFASVRRACLEELQVALKLADDLPAEVMTVHFSRPPKFFSDEDVFLWHRELLAPLCDQAQKTDMLIALEQSPFPQCAQIDIIERLLEELPGLRFQLDSGHAQLEGPRDMWSEYLARLGRFLIHVHLSENDGTHDQHLPLGSIPGNPLDWPHRLRELKNLPYDGTITLEVFSSEASHLLTSRDLLRKWWAEL